MYNVGFTSCGEASLVCKPLAQCIVVVAEIKPNWIKQFSRHIIDFAMLSRCAPSWAQAGQQLLHVFMRAVLNYYETRS